MTPNIGSVIAWTDGMVPRKVLIIPVLVRVLAISQFTPRTNIKSYIRALFSFICPNLVHPLLDSRRLLQARWLDWIITTTRFCAASFSKSRENYRLDHLEDIEKQST